MFKYLHNVCRDESESKYLRLTIFSYLYFLIFAISKNENIFIYPGHEQSHLARVLDLGFCMYEKLTGSNQLFILNFEPQNSNM